MMLEDYYPQYVEAAPDNPNNRIRAGSYNGLASKLADEPGKSGKGFDYYVVDPYHNSKPAANICAQEDDREERVLTLAFLAPQLTFSYGQQSIQALLDEPSPRDVLRESETRWFEYLRARSQYIRDDSEWSTDGKRLVEDDRQHTLIRALRVAKQRYDRGSFPGASGLNERVNFAPDHVEYVIENTFTNWRAATPPLEEMDVTLDELRDLADEYTAPPFLPQFEEQRQCLVEILEAGGYAPRNTSIARWCKMSGFPSTVWNNLLSPMDPINVYDEDRIRGLLYGDELREAFEDALGETFPVYACGGCGEVFETAARRNRHRRDCSEQQGKATCSFCGKEFTDGEVNARVGSHARSHALAEERRNPDAREKFLRVPHLEEAREEMEELTTDATEQHISERPEKPEAEVEPSPGSLGDVFADGGSATVDEFEDIGEHVDLPGPEMAAEPPEAQMVEMVREPEPEFFPLDRGVAREHGSTFLFAAAHAIAESGDQRTIARAAKQLLAGTAAEQRDRVLMELLDSDVPREVVMAFREAEREYEAGDGDE